MATYVLVGGAWIGGWAWRNVARGLRAHGHDVYPMTLTGLGERAHLARPDVDLETHIADVVNVVEYEVLTDVILAGHSYSGIVVTGVADRIPDRLSHLVFVDSAPLEDGQRFLDLFSPEGQEDLRRQVDQLGDGWRLPFPGIEQLGAQASLEGLGDAELALMQAKAVAQPFQTYTQPLRLTNAGAGAYERVAIACSDMRQMVALGIPPIVALTQPPWRYLDLQTGHWPMLSTPDELTVLLHSLAQG
jgi:pimeloyl-ACP methyl ester carboxylesterase